MSPGVPEFRKSSTLDAEPFEVTNWASDHRLELPYDDVQNPVVRWQLRCWGPSCMEGAYIFSPDYTQNVQGGLSFPRLLLHRPHADPNQPDEPQALLTVMDQHRLQDMDCSTDGVLTPFCNYCMKLEPVKMCSQNGKHQFCQPSANHFSIRTTCPHPKFLTERDGHVFFAPSSASNDQYWRLSQPPPPPVSYAANAPNANFDFL
ncbi:unnamed protein product [Durusdinium trenchii]